MNSLTTFFRISSILWILWGAVHILAGVMTMKGILTDDITAAIAGIADKVDPSELQRNYPKAAGAIIGGLLGNQIRRNNSQQIVGYRQEQRCNTNYSTQTQQQYSHSDIVVEVNGMQVNAQTRRKVKVGDTVNVQVTLQVQ